MTSALVSALSTGLAVWLWTGPDVATTRLSRLLRPLTARPDPYWRSLSGLLTRSSPGHRADTWRRASIELCQSLSAELSAGRTPGEALTRAVAAVDFPDPDAMRQVIAAARDGGDVPAALLSSAPPEGGEGLHRLATCWEVGTTVGAGMAALVDRVAQTQRAAQAHRQDVAAQLAGPRTTARMLAFLPALGLLMAAALNMRPLDFLLGSLPGLMCLFAGVALDACGLWWTNRMATRAQT
ncbi:pilus assembly protein TadB [Nonomuraea terrae]|uniref:Pilus assembly protein TadB n=1 Tax=Nonomuraea terrae TaxID=2530383 RepID=A0A4R4XMG1_9ACTN|nr:type II secretion system F family protein [Nonomuraea terrae]TDD32185.1 pilus assembly protein TadB [Nonomuraea terrae]